MLKKGIISALVILFFLLQITIGRSMSIASVSPNLLLVLVCIFGFMYGQKTGLLVGFFSGLLLDTYYGDVIGFYALIYMLLGYANGFFQQMYYDEDVTLPIALLTGSNVSYGIFIYVTRFLMRNRLEFFYYFQHVIMAETVYTLLIAVLVYWPILKMNRAVTKRERKGV